MPTLLYLTTSPRGDYSISRQLGHAAVQAWRARNPEGRIIERDLAKTPLTFVDFDWIAGAYSPPEYHNERHKRAIALSDELVAEVVAAGFAERETGRVRRPVQARFYQYTPGPGEPEPDGGAAQSQ